MRQKIENKAESSLELRRKSENTSSAEKSTPKEQTRDYDIGHMFSWVGGPGSAPPERFSSLLNGTVLSHPTNSTIRNQAFLQMQQGFGNRYVQRMMEKSGVTSQKPEVGIQTKLKISPPGDKYEQEADRIANIVVEKSNRSDLQEDPRKRGALMPRHKSDPSVAQSAGTPDSVKAGISSGRGRPLDESTREFMESRFGYNFSDVRIHTSASAASSAQAMGARAYTVGEYVVFGPGNYDPVSVSGRKLLAHELAHVVQQRSMVEAGQRFTPLQREEEGGRLEARLDDPNFLVCLVLCYLGLPPAIWKSLTEIFLLAVWEEYKATYDLAQAQAEFRSFREEFRAWGLFKTLRHILTFAVQGKVMFVPIRTAAARALQDRMIGFLLKRGLSMAAIATVEQIARKVVLAVELAFAAGCGLYCGAIELARAIVKATQAVAEGIVSAFEWLEAIGELAKGILHEIFVRPLLEVRAMVNPENWELSALPRRTQRDIKVLGFFVWRWLKPEDPNLFVTNITKTLSEYKIPLSLARDIAYEIQQAINRKMPSAFEFTFTSDLLLQLTPLTFVQFLTDWRLLSFRKNPEKVANVEMRQQETQSD